jgi:pimeloyl-ACP methyl ester carboxylesterase
VRPRTTRALLVLACGLLLALTGCTSFAETAGRAAASAADASSATPPPPAPIAWSGCDEQIKPLVAGRPGSDRALTFECGRTDVPIDYAEPRGATLPLFLVRARIAGQTDRIGSLVVNPGGPGRSGTDAVVSLALQLPEELLQRFDLVGLDPRGVGLSTPVQCIPDPVKEQVLAAEPRPVTDQQLTDAFSLAQRIADGCAQQYGDALGAFSTVATARDLDRVRESLGDQQLSFLGYSYGTTLGSTYAELFPDRVRAMVLDGAVDPDADPQHAAEATARGLEAGFDAFAASCTALVAGCPLGPDPRTALSDLLAQAAATPVPSAEAGETRAATPGTVMAAVTAGIADPAAWPQLQQSLAAAQRGDSQGLFTLADGYLGRLSDGTWTNLLDALTAVDCADHPQTYTEDQVRALARDWNARYPLFGAGQAARLYDCTPWRAPRTPLPARDAAGSAPVLVVGNTGDPVTPYQGAQDMARDLSAGVLLTWQGGRGHTSYPQTPCITTAVDTYLVDARPPADGQTCPAS